MWGHRRTRSFFALGALLVMTSCRDEPTTPNEPTTAAPADREVAAAADDSVLLIVAGDVHANCTNPGHRSKRTAPLVERYPDALVIPLGDNAGQSGTVAEHECYDQSWGRFKRRTYPTIGNHELNLDPVATAYYDYWNGVGVDSGKAGHRARGYYAVKLRRVADPGRQQPPESRITARLDDPGDRCQPEAVHHGDLAPSTLHQQCQAGQRARL